MWFLGSLRQIDSHLFYLSCFLVSWSFFMRLCSNFVGQNFYCCNRNINFLNTNKLMFSIFWRSGKADNQTCTHLETPVRHIYFISPHYYLKCISYKNKFIFRTHLYHALLPPIYYMVSPFHPSLPSFPWAPPSFFSFFKRSLLHSMAIPSFCPAVSFSFSITPSASLYSYMLSLLAPPNFHLTRQKRAKGLTHLIIKIFASLEREIFLSSGGRGRELLLLLFTTWYICKYIYTNNLWCFPFSDELTNDWTMIDSLIR